MQPVLQPCSSVSMVHVREDFDFLRRTVNGKPIVYFDNAATTQKPRQVIDQVTGLYRSGISNVHRAVNFLAEEVTQAFESGRQRVARFIGAQSREIVFTSNATHAINLASAMLLKNHPLRVLTTTLEHHSNLLPWTQQCAVEFIPWRTDGSLDMKAAASLLARKPDLVAIARASNFLGVIHPLEELIALCRKSGTPVLVDASQSIAHEPHDVRRLGCDFLVMSGHKIYGPSGIGVLFIRDDFTERLKPALLGGSMVKEVHANSYVPNDVPHRFEAGTPNIEGVVGLAAALDYVAGIGYERLAAHEAAVVQYAKRKLAQIPAVRLVGPPPGVPCAPIVTFHIKNLDSGAVAKVLGGRSNIIVRSGFHCAQPAHEQLKLGPTVRASFGIYNTQEEVDAMVEVLQSVTCLLE